MSDLDESSLNGTQAAALQAVARIVTAAGRGTRPETLRRSLAREARTLLDAQSAIVVGLDPHEGLVRRLASDPASADESSEAHPLAQLAPIEELVTRRRAHVRASGADARAVARTLDAEPADELLVLPLRAGDVLEHALVLLAPDAGGFADGRLDIAAGFATAAGAVLGQSHAVTQQATHAARQGALARAAKALTASLDLQAVLASISREAQRILDADVVAVYRDVGGGDGLVLESGHNLGDAPLGYRMAPGQGLSGRVMLADRPMLTNDYQRFVIPGGDSPFAAVHSCLAVPMRWDGALHGVLAVGYTRPRFVVGDDLTLLEAFAELAAAACRNASAATGLALAAHSDGLTGCLNHAALQDALRREIERCARTGQDLSLVLVDLDDFKAVNERYGHLVGDELLRRAGHALRIATRPYDVVARYGGDEFAILSVDADETVACEIAARAIERLSESVADLGDGEPRTVATAGIAQWEASFGPVQLIEQADRALLFGKQEDRRGEAIAASSIPDLFHPGRFSRQMATDPVQPIDQWRAAGAEPERLARRHRHLAMANALGTRLAAMTEVDEIVLAVVEELHRAFGFYSVVVVALIGDGRIEALAGRGAPFERLSTTGWTQPADSGLIGRSLRERHVVLVNDIAQDPDHTSGPQTLEIRSELVAPVVVAGDLWGAINCAEVEIGAFDEDDARLLQTVADQLGSALRSAVLYEQLSAAYLGTAEALAAALEAKDSYTAMHARSIVEWAEAVGRRLGLADDDLRDLRYGAVFHDIGKIAISEGILNKRGPLDDAERRELERHTEVGEQILAPVSFLAGVRPVVRHEHERWDGAGYPDGLAGEAIPLGARIVFVCDAFHAMTSDRPYRAAMSREAALQELLSHAGSQFDPSVVEAFLDVLHSGAQADDGGVL
jgi:diguanylate cyclase (GGDEF)-like protein